MRQGRIEAERQRQRETETQRDRRQRDRDEETERHTEDMLHPEKGEQKNFSRAEH